jgi:hypothetical protein
MCHDLVRLGLLQLDFACIPTAMRIPGVGKCYLQYEGVFELRRREVVFLVGFQSYVNKSCAACGLTWLTTPTKGNAESRACASFVYLQVVSHIYTGRSI